MGEHLLWAPGTEGVVESPCGWCSSPGSWPIPGGVAAVALRFGRARRVGGIGEQVEDGDGTEWAPDGVPEVPVEPVVYGEHARLPQVPDQGPECDRAGRAPEVEDVRSGGRLSGRTAVLDVISASGGPRRPYDRSRVLIAPDGQRMTGGIEQHADGLGG